jgi:alcohol dehydrogenase
MTDFENAVALLREFKANAYSFGPGTLSQAGARAARYGRRAALVRGTFPGSDECVQQLRGLLAQEGTELVREIKGARPNAPREDLRRILVELDRADADVVLSLGGGSTIDATKAAVVLSALGGDIERYFGTDLVTRRLRDDGGALTPHVAIQTLAGSAAHLTKYSNITDLTTAQKKLIVDEAIVPPEAVFDYDLTRTAPRELTADGAFDGLSHIVEVLYGAVGKPHYDKAARIARAGLSLIVAHLSRALNEPNDAEAREALGLATDLGGYAIMIGGTNGGHLTSFSLVDVLPHGRACAIMNPYYTVFFAPAIEGPLRLVGNIYRGAKLTNAPLERLTGRELGLAIAEAMMALAREVGFPTRLADVPGFDRGHVERALAAAKNPQLEMKLRNMPVPLSAEGVDTDMAAILAAAGEGELTRVPDAT